MKDNNKFGDFRIKTKGIWSDNYMAIICDFDELDNLEKAIEKAQTIKRVEETKG